MNDFFASIFAPLYETFLFQGKYDLIFFSLYDHGGYMYLGAIFVIVSIILVALFYWVPKFPYLKWWHWLIWVMVGSVIVAAFTFGIGNSQIFNSTYPGLPEAIHTPGSGYRDFANSLVIKLSILNAIYAFIASFIFSMLFKRWSKIRMHLPF